MRLDLVLPNESVAALDAVLSAKMLTTLGQPSSGGVDLGAGTGWSVDDFKGLGPHSAAAPRDKAEELLRSAQAILRNYYLDNIFDSATSIGGGNN